jgi:hypothetical protein
MNDPPHIRRAEHALKREQACKVRLFAANPHQHNVVLSDADYLPQPAVDTRA